MQDKSYLEVGEMVYLVVKTNIPFTSDSYRYTHRKLASLKVPYADLHRKDNNIVVLFRTTEEEYLMGVLAGELDERTFKDALIEIESKYENIRNTEIHRA